MNFSGVQLSDGERQAISAAARWYARLLSGSATEQERSDWQHWLQADPLHRLAWTRMQGVSEQMAAIPGRFAGPVLRGAGQSRRQVLRGLALLAGAGSLGALGWRSETAQHLLADYRTGVGERREVPLADGSSLLLNTATSVNVRFDGQQRVLELLAGEMLFNAAFDSLQRPLRIDTRFGRVQTQGAQLWVRSTGAQDQVAVLQQAAQVSLGSGASRVLHAGQSLDFGARELGPVLTSDETLGAWQQGSIIAIRRPLGELLAELSRYRHGVLRCSADIAGLQISGVFPVDNIDLALGALETGFALRISRVTPYWVTVSRA